MAHPIGEVARGGVYNVASVSGRAYGSGGGGGATVGNGPKVSTLYIVVVENSHKMLGFNAISEVAIADQPGVTLFLSE